ncbi:GRAM and VASt domain-containing protein [Sporobolomyces salmoneus]|uniref:GRAM and VASt domain-containing protein n=1 Tax=Sporobolomyces salmoneus TaxID=183962 RepID=UPI0031731CAE
MNSTTPPAPMSQANPVELMRFTQETIRRRIDEQLSPSDRLIAHSAEDITMRYARTGFWIGTLAGGMLAFRSRLIAGRRAMQAGNLPRLFFPSKPGQAGKLEEELAKNAAKADGAAFKEKIKEKSADEIRRSKAVFFGKAIGYGILGSFIGTQSGVYFGKGAADRMLKKSGRIEAIQAAQQRGVALAAQEISQKTGGKVVMEQVRGIAGGSGLGGSREDLEDGIGYQEPGRELSHETMSQGIGYSDRAPPQENFPENLSGAAPSGSTLPGSPSSSNDQSSRWDQLRRSRANPPSSWDVLREANNPSRDSQRQNVSEGVEDSSARESRLDKERRKKEFEALFDQEAKGGDDGLGDKETNLPIPGRKSPRFEKRMTAKVIPNAIEVTTLHASHTFSSFLARDAAFKLIVEICQHVHPGENLAPDGDSTSTPYAAEPDVDVKSQISFEDEKGEKKSHKFKTGIAAIKNHIRSASIDTRKTSSSPTEAEKVKRQAQAGGGGSGGHAATVYDGPEYKNEALDCILPTSPDKAYELFFANEEFLKKFLEEKENLKGVDIGPWKAVDGDAAAKDDDHALKERDMSYLKPLNAPVGPKQTHCIIYDKNDQMDPETVTTEVEWTKVNRMLRGVIERGAIDGQKTYHKDLEEAVRANIEANKDEYGVETSGEPPAPRCAATSSSSSSDSGSFLDMLPVSPTALLLGLVATAARSARIGHPAEVANAVSRVLGDFNSLHQQRVAGASGQGVAGEVEHLKKVLAGLESHISNIAEQVSKAVGQVKEASDRMEGVRAML